MTIKKTIHEIPQDMEKSTKHFIKKKKIYIYISKCRTVYIV